jgi:hypothetical protein
MKQIAGGIDKPSRFFLRQNDGQPARCSWIRDFLDGIVSLQCLAEEEPQRGCVIANGADTLFLLLQQLDLIGAELIPPRFFGAIDGNTGRSPRLFSGMISR